MVRKKTLCDGKCLRMRGQEGQGYLGGHRGSQKAVRHGAQLIPVDCECSSKERSEFCKSRPDLNVWPGCS